MGWELGRSGWGWGGRGEGEEKGMRSVSTLPLSSRTKFPTGSDHFYLLRADKSQDSYR